MYNSRMAERKFCKDNILGWSEEDFIEVVCEMANVRIRNNLPLTPFLNKTYLNNCDEYWFRKYGGKYEKSKEDQYKEALEKIGDIVKTTCDKKQIQDVVEGVLVYPDNN